MMKFLLTLNEPALRLLWSYKFYFYGDKTL